MYTTENKTLSQCDIINKITSGNAQFFQPKLTINTPGDPYEQEADAMADKVMRMPATKTDSPFFQPKPSTITPVQRKCAACEQEEKLQTKAVNGNSAGITAPPLVHDVINSGGQSLDTNTRSFMESRFGYDFSNVQIHNDSTAHSSSTHINAHAYTYSNHIVFAADQYQPSTYYGQRLLAHELTHVVQQKKQSIPPATVQRDIVCYNTPGSSSQYGGGVGVTTETSAEAPVIRTALSPLIQAGKIIEISSVHATKTWFAADHNTNIKSTDIEVLLKAAGYADYVKIAQAILDPHAEFWLSGKTTSVMGLPPPPKAQPELSRNESRDMTEFEIHEAKRVFGSQLNYRDVTLEENSTVHTVGGYARTIYNTIYFPDYVPSTAFLIHELTHVWQYQKGADLPGMIFEAIVGKYDYGKSEGLKKAWEDGKAFDEFTTEQQGDILSDYYTILSANGDTSAYDNFVQQVKSGKEKEHRYKTVEPLPAGKLDWVKMEDDHRIKIEAEIIEQLKIPMKLDDDRAPARAKQVIALFKSFGSYWYGTYGQRFIDRKSSDELINLVFHNLSYESRVRIYKAISLDKKYWK